MGTGQYLYSINILSSDKITPHWTAELRKCWINILLFGGEIFWNILKYFEIIPASLDRVSFVCMSVGWWVARLRMDRTFVLLHSLAMVVFSVLVSPPPPPEKYKESAATIPMVITRQSQYQVQQIPGCQSHCAVHTKQSVQFVWLGWAWDSQAWKDSLKLWINKFVPGA